MQLMIISLPAGEQVANLSHSLNADELFIGQSESCQIRLPDRQNQVADQHVRLVREDRQWYVENLSDHPLHINQIEVPVRARQRMLLSDGDILFCGDYQLAASDFSPWLGASGLLEQPELSAVEDQAPDYCILPSASDEKELNDPFAAESSDTQPDPTHSFPEARATDKPMSPDDTSLVDFTLTSSLNPMTQDSSQSPGGQSQNLQDHSPLIDILSESDELDNDWNIHRGLWYGKITQPGEPHESCFHSPQTDDSKNSEHPVVTRIPRIFAPPPHHGDSSKTLSSSPSTNSSTSSSTSYQRSIFQAMLSALDQIMDDFCPDRLATQFKQTASSSSPVTDTCTTNRIRRYFGWQPEPVKPVDFQISYQHFYEQLMSSKRYRLLFLQRFRQALKEQEQQPGSRDTSADDVSNDDLRSDDLRSDDLRSDDLKSDNLRSDNLRSKNDRA